MYGKRILYLGGKRYPEVSYLEGSALNLRSCIRAQGSIDQGDCHYQNTQEVKNELSFDYHYNKLIITVITVLSQIFPKSYLSGAGLNALKPAASGRY